MSEERGMKKMNVRHKSDKRVKRRLVNRRKNENGTK